MIAEYLNRLFPELNTKIQGNFIKLVFEFFVFVDIIVCVDW
jgi:hypothetical protein